MAYFVGNNISTASESTPSSPGTGQTLESPADSISYTVSNSENVFTIPFHIVSNVNSNEPFLTFNDDSAQTGYTVSEGFTNSTNISAYNANNATPLLAATINDEDIASGFITVSRTFDGTNTYLRAKFHGHASNGIAFGTIEKVLSGDISLEKINIYSDQSNGFAANSKIG